MAVSLTATPCRACTYNRQYKLLLLIITQRAPRLLKEIGRASHKLDAARAELADKREALLRLARSASFSIYFINPE